MNTYEIEFADVLLDAVKWVTADSFSCEDSWIRFYIAHDMVAAVPAANVRIVRKAAEESGAP